MKRKPINLSSFMFLILMLTNVLNVYGLEYTISFTGSGASTSVESVIIQNLTQGTSLTVANGNSLNLTVTPNSIPQLSADNSDIQILQNSVTGKSSLIFNATQSGNTQINIYSIDGQKVIGISSNLQEGKNSFQLLLSRGAYLIQVSGNGYVYSAKFINHTTLQTKPDLIYQGTERLAAKQQKSKSSVKTMSYTDGDHLLFKGVSGIYSTVVAAVPTGNMVVNFDFTACQDGSGNNYAVVNIGNQTWMAENLKTTKYMNGDNIGTDFFLSTDAWCDYNDDTFNGSKYGKLYNWNAVLDSRKIAPVGWHVPSSIEWSTLNNYLIANGGNYDGTTTDNKISKSLAATTDWNLSSNVGAIGNNLSANNSSGFTALPGGSRYLTGTSVFANLGNCGQWISSDLGNSSPVGLSYDYNSLVGTPGLTTANGLSVRCVKDATVPVVTTSVYSTNISTTATMGGNVTFEGGASVTVRGVCWSTNPNPTIADSKTINGSGTGIFMSSITGLTVGQTYYLRAYATNSFGTGYGNLWIITPQVFNQEAVFAKIYATLGLTGDEQPAGKGDVPGVDEVMTSFVRSIWNINELTTDEAICSWYDSYALELNFNQFTSSNQELDALYRRLYFDITLCNRFLMETALINDVTTLKERAEARFMRALNYYYLLDLFGKVPFTEIDSYANASQLNRADLYAYIVTELAACEPDMSEPRQAPYGRADKAANWLLRSRLYLNAEAYSGTANWADAANYAKKVIDSGYTLCPTYKQLFMADNGGAFDGSTVNTANQEIILPIYADGIKAKSYGSSEFLIGSTHAFGMNDWGSNTAWAGNRARATLIKKFFPTGSTFFNDSKDLTSAILVSLKDNRAKFDKSSVSLALNITTVSNFKEGYSVTKFSNVRADGAATSNTEFVDMDVPFLRAAEAYLTYAEAMLRTGNNTEALTAINKLRARAGAIMLTTIDLPTILDEKAREFFFEGQRRTDLIRFGNYGGGTYNWDWKGGVAAGTTFDAHYNLFPIPQQVLNENPNLMQNPGY